MIKQLFALLIFSVMLFDGSAATGEQSNGDACLKLHETSHDFGDVMRRGGDLIYDFYFTNNGTAPLVLTRVVTSCSCLKAHFQRRPIAAGEQGMIRIVYEPQKSEPGVFNKVIQIYSNSRDGREVITVQGNSLDAPRVKIKNEKVKIKGGE